MTSIDGVRWKKIGVMFDKDYNYHKDYKWNSSVHMSFPHVKSIEVDNDNKKIKIVVHENNKLMHNNRIVMYEVEKSDIDSLIDNVKY
tara:strand:- start:318 stop:578 length:261 start_codon:yes stop_codon:yes gene_type:complete